MSGFRVVLFFSDCRLEVFGMLLDIFFHSVSIMVLAAAAAAAGLIIIVTKIIGKLLLDAGRFA